MPVRACTLDGKPGYQYGGSGKCYTYDAKDDAARRKAKQQAYLQGAAITGGHPEKTEKDLSVGDVHVPTSIGTSLAQRRMRYTKFTEELPAEIVVREGFVAGLALRDGMALRLDRLPVVAHVWSALRKAAEFRLIDAGTLGEEPLYDLILRKRAVADEKDAAEEDRPFRLLKSDSPQRIVTGVVFEPNTVDTQGDYEKSGAIEQACHDFLTKYRLKQAHLGHSHARRLGDEEATLVENYIAPADLTIGTQAVKKGSWIQSWQLAPTLWDQVEKGDLTGFSFGGSGVRKYVDDVMKEALAQRPVTPVPIDLRISVQAPPREPVKLRVSERDAEGRAAAIEEV